MPLKLLELVYEGGDVVDVALARQRRILRSSLGDEFATVDLRRKNVKQRENLLVRLAQKNPKFVLLRGISMIDEAAPFFSKSRLFLDYLAMREAVPADGLFRFAFRVTRAYAYSDKGVTALRAAGLGRISAFPGPMLPPLPEELPEGKVTVGVLDVGDGALDVIVRLKKLRKSQNWDIDIASTRRMAGVVQYETEFEVGEASHLIVAPMDFPDRGGPHEPALLAMSLGRALCTSTSSAFYGLPVVPTGGGYIPAKKYEPGTYAASYGVYVRDRAKYDQAFSTIRVDPQAVPKDLLSRM